MNTFTVNGKEYKAKQFNFGLVCELEEMGIPLEGLKNKPMSTVLAYFCLCAGKGKDFAAKEIDEHIISGGNLNNVISVMTEEIKKSDFFQALNKRTLQEVATDKEEQNREADQN